MKMECPQEPPSEEYTQEEPPFKKHKSDQEAEESCPNFNAKASGGADGMLDLPSFDNMDLLDEVQDEDGYQYGSDDAEMSYESEVPEDEIDELLEAGLPEEMKGPLKSKQKSTEKNETEENYERREKVVLADRDVNHFEVLPEGWVEVSHHSGMPVYLHRDTRVCTFSKPYFLGPGSARKHEVPISAIPCLQYQRMKEKRKQEEEEEEEEKKQQEIKANEDRVQSLSVAPKEDSLEATLPPGPLADALVAQAGLQVNTKNTPIPLANDPLQSKSLVLEAKVESAGARNGEFLEPEKLMEYCERRFKFKTIKLLKFPSWEDKRKFEKMNHKKNLPQLPHGTNLITLKRKDGNDALSHRRQWVINPKGKSYVCILHEYVQHILKSQPKYIFQEVENAATPYAATLVINDMKYSTGYGTSKKQAKMEVAKTTLEILLPELGKKLRQDKEANEDTDLSLFDEIKIEDHRVPDLCHKTSELSPYSVLLNCLQRNFGLSDNGIETKLIAVKNQKNEFIMKVGKHNVKVPCRNKKDGKHKASQALLQKLHPHINSWGSLLRLYGSKSLQLIRDKKTEEQEITLLQSNATQHQPNTSIINKLKEEMMKLKSSNQVQPIGKFMPPQGIGLPSTQGTELNNVNL